MSEKKQFSIFLEDYSFTNKIIKVKVEQSDTMKGVTNFVRTNLGLKKEKIHLMFGKKESKKFQELTKKTLSLLWELAEQGDVILQVRRKIDIDLVRKIRDEFQTQKVDLPVSVLKVENVSNQETIQRIEQIALDFLTEIAEDPRNAAFRIPS